MLESIKAWTASVDNTIVKWGGGDESPNLFGYGYSFAKGAVMAPFRALKWVWNTTRLMFTKPDEAMLELRFVLSRLKMAGAALLGIRMTYYPATSYSDAGYQVDYKRFAIGGIASIYGWLFAGIFAEAKLYTLSIIFGIGPMSIWLIAGVPSMIRRYKSYRRETWEAEVARVKLSEQNQAMAEVQNSASELVKEKDVAEELSETHEGDVAMNRAAVDQAEKAAEAQRKVAQAAIDAYGEAKKKAADMAALHCDDRVVGRPGGILGQMTKGPSGVVVDATKIIDVEVEE